MKERLEKFMVSERLTSSRLAEILGVQPSNVSHILSGRNKPSFDFIEKMLQRFPKINPDWFLLGKGNMYRISENHSPVPASTLLPLKDNLLFETSSEIDVAKQPDVHPISSSRNEVKEFEEPQNLTSKQSRVLSDAKKDVVESDVERIVIFLKNKTFLIYEPQ